MKITQQYILALLVAAVVAATTPDAFAQKGGFKGRSKSGGGFSMRSAGGTNNSQSNSNNGVLGKNFSPGSSSGKSTQFSPSAPKLITGGTPGGGLSGRLGGLSGKGSNVITLPGSKGQATSTLPGGKLSGRVGGKTGLLDLPSSGKLSGITLPGKGITLPGGTRLPGMNLPGNQNPGNANAGNANNNGGNNGGGNNNNNNGNGNGNGNNNGNNNNGGGNNNGGNSGNGSLKHAFHHWLNCHDVQHNHCVTHTTWCHQVPRHCHWWYNYCPTIYTNYTHCVPCNWTVIPCYANGVVITEYRWYLGLSGMVLPGKGLGIETVEAGSPAAEVGLAPGMIIVGCNGFALTDNAQMAEAIRTSNGILRLDVKVTEDAEIQTVDVAMRRLVSSSF